MEIGLRAACERDRALITNLFNMYQNELSVYSDRFLYLDDQGYFDKSCAGEVLPFGGGVYPYIITDGGRNVGFLLVTDAPYVLSGCDHCVQELFVIARLRGTGAAREAVRAALKPRGGRWCLSVFENNMRARAFWQKTIREFGTDIAIFKGEKNMLDYVFTCREDI